MLKKLYQHLLENYPLVWNMRLVSILALMLLVHLLHFTIGYCSFTTVEAMGWNGPSAMFFETPLGLFSLIGSFIIFILWLMRVLRNNGFKSFYPFTSPQLFAQFLIFVVVSFLNISYYFSFTEGYTQSGKRHTDLIANKKDAETYNNILPFVAEEKGTYAIENRCTPIPFPMIKKFRSDREQTTKSKPETVVANLVEEAAIETAATDIDKGYYLGQDGNAYTYAQLDSLGGHFTYSYLNYCENNHFDTTNYYRDFHFSEDRFKNRKTIGNLLLHNPEQIKTTMQTFIMLCNKYNVRYDLDANEWYKWVNNPPFFPVEYTIHNQYYYPGSSNTDIDAVEAVPSPENEVNPKGYFVQLSKLENIIDNTFKVHYYYIDYNIMMVLLHVALAFALLLFTFRASSKRVWLITFIGSFLLSMILGAFTALISMNSGKSMIAILAFYLGVIILFFVVHLITKRKIISGVTLNLFVWFAPLIIPLIYGIFDAHERNIEINSKAFEYQKPASMEWVEHNTTAAVALCLMAYILFLCILVPRYRRWQAMPED